MKKFDFSKEFGNIDPKYIEEAEREWSEKKENRRPKGAEHMPIFMQKAGLWDRTEWISEKK